MESMSETDVEGEPTFIEAPAPVARKPKPQQPMTKPLSALERADELAMVDWISSLAGDSEIKINIYRKKPIVGPNGENVGGSLETVTSRIDEDYIRNMWGGGTFRLSIQAMTPQGDYKWVKGGNRQIEIAGPCKMAGATLAYGQGSGGPIITGPVEDSMAERAFNELSRTAREERARADQYMNERNKGGFDIHAMQALNAPMFAQLEQAQRTISELQQQMIMISTKPPQRDEFRDKLMERALDGEGGRIESLRTLYEGRIEKLRDNHEDQLKRIEDRHNADIKRLEDRHSTDIKRLEDRHEFDRRSADKTADLMSKNIDVAYQARLESLKDDKVRMQAELAAAATKIAALEARKDQTMGEKVEEISKLQEVFENFGGGGDDEGKWYEKAISAVGSLPAVNGMLEKLTGPGPQAAAPAQPQNQLPPPGVPYQTGDGNIYVRDHVGNVSIVDQGQMRQQRQLEKARRKKRAATAQAGAPAEAPAEGDAIEEGLLEDPVDVQAPPIGPAPKPADVKLAITFMENAMRGGAPPEAFAATARNMLDQGTMTFIQQVGPEEFLNKWARLEVSSPLASIGGRQWVRKVFKHLVGDDSE